MATCPSCTRESPDGFLFCGMCGTPLGPPKPVAVGRKTVTLLFSDVSGSTAMGEARDAESVRAVMDRYFVEMRRVLEHHGGMLEKFIGDAVMAVFGIPVVHEDDALRAVRAAAEMRAALASLNDALLREWGVRIDVRTGVNTGEVVADDPSSARGFATGDTVNTAARLEQAAPAGEILIGESTYRLVAGAVNAEPVAPLSLKGKSEPVPAYRLIEVLPDVAVRGRARSAFVGRRAERDALAAALERARARRRCGFVVVLGEPGVGKSRLVEEFASAAGEGVTELRGRCHSYGESDPLRPVADMLRRAASIGPTDPEAVVRDKLCSMLAGIDDPAAALARVAALVSLFRDAGAVEEDFWAVRRVFEHLARSRTVLIVVEDIQWADEVLLRLLAHVAEFGTGAPILIVCTARTDPVLDNAEWATSLPGAELMTLGPLDPGESSDLVGGLLPEGERARAIRNRISEAAGGNPLFIVETVSMLAESGLLSGDGPRGDLTRVSIPPSIAGLLGARLDHLTEAERDLLGRAAVDGTEFTREALLALTDDLGPERMDGLLDELVRKGFVRVGAGPARRLGFENRLMRDAAYGRLPKQVRAAMHERLAGWLADRPASITGPPVATARGSDDLVGYHLELAYQYRLELGTVDARALVIARTAATRLASACRLAIAHGSASTASDLLARAADLLRAAAATLDREEVELAADLGKSAVTLGAWDRAVAVLDPYRDSGSGPVLRDLGVATCKLHQRNRGGPEYRRGQRYLEMAAGPPNRDPDALASLAGTWKGVDEHRAHELYRRALELDPSNPYSLGNHLEYEVASRGNLTPVTEEADAIAEAVARCREQARRGANLPWAWYDAGKFELLLGRSFESVAAYAKAIQLTTSAFMIDGARTSLERLAPARHALLAIEWARKLLLVGRLARFPVDGEVEPTGRAIDGAAGRVVILTGGSDRSVEEQMRGYRRLLVEAFRGFDGVVVSGGTTAGISRLAGDVAERSEGRIRAVGYVPGTIPDGVAADTDPARYREIRRTDGHRFTPLEPLQGWVDLLASGVDPANVRLIGINGGSISGSEYRTALALGAGVGILRGSGRAADALFEDPDWVTAPNLVPLPADPDGVRAFLSAGSERVGPPA